jgi:hypothetical protein
MPAAYYFAVVRGGGLVVAWSWIVPPYMAINATLVVAFFLKDWDKLAHEIRVREGIVRQDSDIEGLVLVEETHAHTTGNGYSYGATEPHNGADKFFDAVSD